MAATTCLACQANEDALTARQTFGAYSPEHRAALAVAMQPLPHTEATVGLVVFADGTRYGGAL